MYCIVSAHATDHWLWMAFVLRTAFKFAQVVWNSAWRWLRCRIQEGGFKEKERKWRGERKKNKKRLLIDMWSQWISDRDKTITSASIWKIISQLWDFLTWFKSVAHFSDRYCIILHYIRQYFIVSLLCYLISLCMGFFAVWWSHTQKKPNI